MHKKLALMNSHDTIPLHELSKYRVPSLNGEGESCLNADKAVSSTDLKKEVDEVLKRERANSDSNNELMKKRANSLTVQCMDMYSLASKSSLVSVKFKPQQSNFKVTTSLGNQNQSTFQNLARIMRNFFKINDNSKHFHGSPCIEYDNENFENLSTNVSPKHNKDQRNGDVSKQHDDINVI